MSPHKKKESNCVEGCSKAERLNDLDKFQIDYDDQL